MTGKVAYVRFHDTGLLRLYFCCVNFCTWNFLTTTTTTNNDNNDSNSYSDNNTNTSCNNNNTTTTNDSDGNGNGLHSPVVIGGTTIAATTMTTTTTSIKSSQQQQHLIELYPLFCECITSSEKDLKDLLKEIFYLVGKEFLGVKRL